MKTNKDERLRQITDAVDRINSLTGRSWVMVTGNPHVSCEWRLTTGQGAGISDLLIESNMLSSIATYLNGVLKGIEMATQAEQHDAPGSGNPARWR